MAAQIFDPEALMRQLEEKNKPFDYSNPPKTIDTTRRIQGRLCVAGHGRRPARVMIIATSVEEDEATETAESLFNVQLKQKAEYLKGWSGMLLKDILGTVPIAMDDVYYTALIKALLPKNKRRKPDVEEIHWFAEALEHEIREVQPEIVVCLGRPAFDFMTGLKLRYDEIKCGWFHSPKFDCLVYPMDDLWPLISKPDYTEKFHTNFREVRKMMDTLEGRAEVDSVYAVHDPTYYTISDSFALQALVDRWRDEKRELFSVDCEWAGRSHIDGKLRSIQFSWAAGQACYIRFMDDNGRYVFDILYHEVGKILASYLNQEHIKYVGHHIAADFPWMHTWLGLDFYNKCVLDTEFAQQTVDEYEDLGLERIALNYTNMGRYDLPLLLWKKDNKKLVSDNEGYGRIPDEIMIPYACADVDVVMRAYPFLRKELERQDLTDYYDNIFLPFTTNVFTMFALIGLPVDVDRLDELRELYNFARGLLERDLKEAMYEEAEKLLGERLAEAELPQDVIQRVFELVKGSRADVALQVIKEYYAPEALPEIIPVLDHYVCSPAFNIRSSDHLKRWLYDVKGYIPIKSTSQKEKGFPSVDWTKVLSYPPERQKEYKPSVDKQSLLILSETHSDPVLFQLLELNAVGNQAKAFLKEADVDADGNVVKENGLHYWLSSNRRVHGQLSATETGRPRSWKPNSLNWPSYVQEKINKGILRVFTKYYSEVPAKFRKYVDKGPNGKPVAPIPSLRSVVDVSKLEPLPGSEGWCLVESDYATAEIRGLAFKSGDENLIKYMTEMDTDFVMLKELDDKGEAKFVRRAYDHVLDMPKNKQVPSIIMAKTYESKEWEKLSEEEKAHYVSLKRFVLDDGTIVVPGRLITRPTEWYTEDDLAKTEDGQYIHPPHDLHWSLAEMTNEYPREFLKKKPDRDAAKVGNFSSAYGATANTLERKIEADTGKKPPEGMGDKMLGAIKRRQPVAVAFLEEMQDVPVNAGSWRSESGRVRHCPLFKRSKSNDKSLLSALGREMRNFPMQESVAATAARASNWLTSFFYEKKMYARPFIVLYDSVVTICPIEERFEVAKAHKEFMTDINCWSDHGRVWNYPSDTEFNQAWSFKPNKTTLKMFNDSGYCSDYSKLKPCDKIYYDLPRAA